jgi:hypothetical protein
MSQEHPEGVLVHASERRFKPTLPPEAHERGFAASSLDLLSGTDVIETPIDSLPGEFTEAFGKPVDTR